MKKIVPALLLVLGIAVSSADADYVLIRFKAPEGAAAVPMGAGRPPVGPVKPGDPVYATALVEARAFYYKGLIPVITTKWSVTANNPTYLYHLGLAHQKAGNMIKAKDALESALKKNPNYREAQEALRNLVRG